MPTTTVQRPLPPRRRSRRGSHAAPGSGWRPWSALAAAGLLVALLAGATGWSAARWLDAGAPGPEEAGDSDIARAEAQTREEPSGSEDEAEPEEAAASEPVRQALPDLWLSPEEIAVLPTSGQAWEGVLEAADESLGDADIADQDSKHDTSTLAIALVYARTGAESYRERAAEAIDDAIGSEEGGRTLALGRNLPGYVIAADLIDLGDFDPEADERLRAWLREVRTRELDGRTLVSTQEDRPNNWGTHAGAARIAASAYLGDDEDVAAAARVFRGWLGDRAAYSEFAWGRDLSWHCDEDEPRGINPAGCTREGHPLDGVIPDDQRRGGSLSWPPPRENYAWEGLQGAVAQAALLDRQGFDSWEWEDQALRRAATWLHEHADYPAEGDDTWQPWLLNDAYGSEFPTESPSRPGKNLGWTDWTHGQDASPISTDPGAPAPSPEP